ncbi:hypothetical protein IBX73_04575 [candidate division WOR-3 bacterium]|nr:hypothetical protein [candidate division WOR-3 bacterium]
MKKNLVFVLVCGFLLIYCGAPQEGPKVEAEQPTGADIYYTPLAEAELQKLIKAMPVFKTEVEKLEAELKPGEVGDRLQSVLAYSATLDKQLPGLDAKLRAAGMAWNEFWPAYSKTTLAIGAVMIDSAMFVMQQQMKDQPPQMLEQALSSLEESRTIYKDVPQASRDLVKKYMKDLVTIFEME